MKAIADVLGWKPKAGDTKGFVGALSQAFTLTEVEGHIESKWTPRTYAIQTDLAGGVTGAQASVYSRGKDALDQSLPLLDGLYALDPEADPEDVAALKAVVKSQLTELVAELGFLGGPRVSRVNQYFNLLLGANTFPLTPPPRPNQTLSQTDPDRIQGTLGNLRDELGLNFTTQDFVNSVADEQDLSNYRVVSDYITTLAQSWLNNLGFLGLDTATPFFGTQLVLLSRQLSVVSEDVDEVRFTLDSVFIGPAERQTMEVYFTNAAANPPMFLEDLLAWIQGFASEEGPRLIQDGGKFGVQNTFLPVASQLLNLLNNIPTTPPAVNPLPPGFYTPRVQLSLQSLRVDVQDLVNLAAPIEHVITPEPDFGLPFGVAEVLPASASTTDPQASSFPIRVRGSGFEILLPGAAPSVSFPAASGITVTRTYFRSENLLVAILNVSGAVQGTWDITVTNADGTSVTLPGALTVTP